LRQIAFRACACSLNINKKRKNPGIEKNKNKALLLPLLKNFQTLTYLLAL